MQVLTLIALFLSLISQAPKRLTYDDDVRPVFQRHCFTCHGAAQMTAGLSLESYAGVLKGGGSGEIVKPGRSALSLLYQVVAQETDGIPRMPFGQAKIADNEVAVIRDWIDQGLLADATSVPKGQTAPALDFKPAAPNPAKGPAPMPDHLPVIATQQLDRPHPVTALAASPSAPLVAVAGHEQIYLYDLNTRALLGSIPFPEGIPYVLRFNRDGSTLLAGGGRNVQSGRVALYDVPTGRRIGTIGQESDIVLAADLSPDGKMIALGGPSKLVKVFSVADGKVLYELKKHTDWITALSFSPDGALLATADRAGGIVLWQSRTGAIVVNLAEHKDAVTALAWRSDSRVLASGGEDGELVTWNAEDGFPINIDTKSHIPKIAGTVYGKPLSGVLSVDFIRDGRIVTVGRDRIIHIFGSDGKPAAVTTPFTTMLTKVAAAYDSKLIAAGDFDGQLILWDGRATQILKAPDPQK